MNTDISLLPRADLPVIWDDFKAKAELVRTTAETLTVTSITQKDEMALARKTRLTLREIRVAVEHKRVELGEGHLKEIQKVNGAARAIREFIEPLEARLLIQESFAEQYEILRIAELTRCRNAELFALWKKDSSARPHVIVKDVGFMTQESYDELLAHRISEQAELEAANRLRVEAERKLAETEAAAKAAIELAQRVALEEKQRQDAEAERIRLEQEAKHRAELSAVAAQRTLEREAAEAKAQEVYADLKRKNEAEHAIRVIEALRLAEEKRIRDEQYAKLQAENAAAEEKLAAIALDAARVAAVEEKRLRDIEVAPDVEKLRDFAARIQGLKGPVLVTREGRDCFGKVALKFNEMVSIIHDFCRE